MTKSKSHAVKFLFKRFWYTNDYDYFPPAHRRNEVKDEALAKLVAYARLSKRGVQVGILKREFDLLQHQEHKTRITKCRIIL